MQIIYIGIDNGVTGSIGIVYEKTKKYELLQTPVKKEKSYTKDKQQITRVCFDKFFKILQKLTTKGNCYICLERPFCNPVGFKATVSAFRCLESQLIAIEQLEIPFEYIDSRKWQRLYLKGNLKTSKELKAASLMQGIEEYPKVKEEIEKQKDADALFIAKWVMEN